MRVQLCLGERESILILRHGPSVVDDEVIPIPWPAYSARHHAAHELSVLGYRVMGKWVRGDGFLLNNVTRMGDTLTDEYRELVSTTPTCDVCGTTCEELPGDAWCGECGCCTKHCQKYTDCRF